MVSSRSSSSSIDGTNEKERRSRRRRSNSVEDAGLEEEGVNNGVQESSSSSSSAAAAAAAAAAVVSSNANVGGFSGEATDSAISRPGEKAGRETSVVEVVVAKAVADDEEGSGSSGSSSSSGNGRRRTTSTDGVVAEWGRRRCSEPISPPSPSLSMSLDLRNRPLGSASPQNDSGHYSSISGSGSAGSAASAVGSNVVGVLPAEINGLTSSCENDVKLVSVRDDEESYEGFGFGSGFGSGFGVDGDPDVDGEPEDGDSPGGTNSAPSPTTGSNPFGRNPRSPNSTIGRHSWLRTSLRRTPPCSGRKRLSSNALASQLYRSGSFNSSGRGSNCDTTDDMYSDVSLEEDVIDLNHRPMCDPKSSCESTPPKAANLVHQSNMVRPPPYGYYPRYVAYDPYGIPPYLASCQNNLENVEEVTSQRRGWFRFMFIVLIILILLFYGLYRFSRRNRQIGRQRNAAAQPVRRNRDAIQNCPTEFYRCTGMIETLRRECRMPCENCRKIPFPIAPTSSRRDGNRSLDGNSEDLERGIINLPPSKIDVATGVSNLNTNMIDRSSGHRET